MYYSVAQVQVTDPDGSRRYVEGHTPTVERHGGRLLAAGGAVSVVEGNLHPEVLVTTDGPTAHV